MSVDREIDIHDSGYVRDLFDRVAATYGYANYLASFGFTERWRNRCIDNLGRMAEGAVGFDLMCGRGETWTQLLRKHAGIAKLTGLDISPAMIEGARAQATRLGTAKVDLLQQDVFDNTIESGSADFVVSTFGVKTFDPEQLRQLAAQIGRILKPGGCFSLIEVSEPRGWFLRPLYMFYLRRAMPIIEKLFLGYSYGFSMIGIYVAQFGDCRELQQHLQAAGLTADFRSYFFGCASGLVGFKPVPVSTTSAMPPRIMADAMTRRGVNVSPRKSTPAKAVITGTLSWMVAALVALSAGSAVYQMAYPIAEVRAPDAAAYAMPA